MLATFKANTKKLSDLKKKCSFVVVRQVGSRETRAETLVKSWFARDVVCLNQSKFEITSAEPWFQRPKLVTVTLPEWIWKL